jgi:hypothetical protein
LHVQGPDPRPLVVVEHGKIDRARNVIERELGGRAHVDHLVKVIELCYGYVCALLHGGRCGFCGARRVYRKICGTARRAPL